MSPLGMFFAWLFQMNLALGQEFEINPDFKKFTTDPNYDKNKLPPSDGPLQVKGQMNLRNILDVSESKQLISLETTLTFKWKDTRITPKLDRLDKNKNYMILSPRHEKEFWMPDMFIDQAKAIRKPKYLIEPASIRLYSDSTIRYSRRMNYDVACSMTFRKFPFDNQTCRIIIHSFSHTTDEYQLSWSRDSYKNSRINLAQFTFDISYTDEYDMKEYDVVYPGLIATITFDRIKNYHIIQTYIPSGLFIIVSYLTLFMPPTGLVARSGVPVLVLLTLFNMNNGIRANVPKVSYATYLDIWITTCFLLVFLTLFEFCLVHCINDWIKREDIAKKIEITFRFLLPSLFIVFIIFYVILFYWGDLDSPLDLSSGS